MIVCGKSVTRLQNKTITSMWNTFLVYLFCSAEIIEATSLSHSIVFHMLLRISLVLPVFLVHATAKIWRDFSTFSPSIMFRELWLPFTKLYIFDKLQNVQSTVDRRNWTRVNTWPWLRWRRHRSWASRIQYFPNNTGRP